MSHIIRKPTFCIDMGKQRGISSGCTCAADQQAPLFSYIDLVSTSYQIRNFKPLGIFYGCTAWFVSDLAEIPNTGFLMTLLISGTTLIFTTLHISELL